MLSLNTGPSRLALAAVLAAPLVYGLFLIANGLITVDHVEPEEKEIRVLEAVTPQKTDPTGPRPTIRVPKIEAAQKPPPPPAPGQPSLDIPPMGGLWTGAAPDSFAAGKINLQPASANPFDGRNLTPVRAPAPSIPAAAVHRGISGSCDVHFDVDTAGRPQNVSAQCTDNLFQPEAQRAVRRAEFLPAIRNGQPVEQKNAVYPIEFKVQ